MSAFFLLLSSAFLHALWNAIVKKIHDKDGFLLVSMTVSYILAAVLAWQIDHLNYGNSHGFMWSLAAGLFEGGYFLTLSATLKRSALGPSYAIMRGGAMLLVWMVALSVLDEKVGPFGLVGTVLIFVGIVFAQDVKFKALMQKEGYQWPYLCAAFIAGYHLCYDRALHEGAKPMSSFAIAMITALPFLFYQARGNMVVRSQNIFKQNWGFVSICGIAATASFGIFLWGLSISAPGFAISLRNTSILFAAVFSVLLGDKLKKSQVIGIVAITVGAVLLGLS